MYSHQCPACVDYEKDPSSRRKHVREHMPFDKDLRGTGFMWVKNVVVREAAFYCGLFPNRKLPENQYEMWETGQMEKVGWI